MNFLLSEAQEQLFDAVLRYASEAGGGRQRRRSFDAGTDFDRPFWNGIMELGAAALLIPERFGGVGLEMIDQAIAAEALGAAGAPGPFLGHVLAAHAIALSGDAEQQMAWLPRLASGEIVATVALAGPDPSRWPLLLHDNTLSGKLGDVIGGHVADLFVVGMAGGDLALVEKGTGVIPDLLDGSDRTRRIADVTLDKAPAVLMRGSSQSAQALVDAALVLLAADAFGGARTCLEMSAEYARTREQFGRPIGSFQGLKFQIADMAQDVEPARGLYWYAAHAYDHVAVERTRMAAIAKAHLGDVFMQAARQTIEVHGGIGYTWEHDAQIYFRRAMFDFAWLGTPAEHRNRQARLAGW